MSEHAARSRTGSSPADALRQEEEDPGHFARQGDYDDPRASLVHDDAVAPEGDDSQRPRETARPSDTSGVADEEYRAWRDAELDALDGAYAAWREDQRNAFDAAYLAWRDAPGQTSFAQWCRAVSASHRTAGAGASPGPRPAPYRPRSGRD